MMNLRNEAPRTTVPVEISTPFSGVSSSRRRVTVPWTTVGHASRWASGDDPAQKRIEAIERYRRPQAFKKRSAG